MYGASTTANVGAGGQQQLPPTPWHKEPELPMRTHRTAGGPAGHTPTGRALSNLIRDLEPQRPRVEADTSRSLNLPGERRDLLHCLRPHDVIHRLKIGRRLDPVMNL